MKPYSYFLILLSIFSSASLLAVDYDFYTIQESGKYFTLDGHTCYYTGRTPSERTLDALFAQFDIAEKAGEKIIRLNAIWTLAPKSRGAWEKFMIDGSPNEDFYSRLDSIFEAGAERGLHFCVTMDLHHVWQINQQNKMALFDRANIFHKYRKGPADEPLDILKDDATQEKYLEYFKTSVQYLSKHENIFTWEIISEINVSFRDAPDDLEREYIRDCDTLMRKVYRVIHENDPLNRPVQVSLAPRARGVPISEWEDAIYGNDSICDFIDFHNYPGFGNNPPVGPEDAGGLALYNIDSRNRNLKYNKLAFIGECDLGFGKEASKFNVEGVDIEYRKSLWGNMVFGISNGGMWWFHSGYDKSLFPGYQNRYPLICKPVNDFVKDIDFTGMDVLATGHEKQVIGSAIGNKDVIIGYFWSEACKYNYYTPESSWPINIETTSSVSLKVIQSEFFNTQQTIHFYNPEDLRQIKTETVSVSKDGVINIQLPTFTSDIVFSIGYEYTPRIVHVSSVELSEDQGDIPPKQY